MPVPSLTLDAYERKARLTPGIFAILPVACAVTTLGLDRFRLIAGLAGLLTAAGGAWLLSTFVGDIGRATQNSLFDAWGGAPTTNMLRTRVPTDNPLQRETWRTAVASLTGIELLTADEETSHPNLADQRILTATAQILHLGQAGGDSAVRNENAAFGYQRNLFGFRHFGRGIAAASIAVLFGAIVGPWHVATSACGIGAVVCGGFLWLWTLLPSEARTRLAAERYARQLLISAHNHSRKIP